MKKVIIVSKTHLDLGFTDYAENVLNKYLTNYIPNAIKTANQVNTDSKKKFVWTTGSWLLKKALEKDDDKLVYNALKSGNIAPHALPFTLHTELLDKDSLDFALGIVDELDEITGIKTTAAKMTDVPGHTISLVPILAKHGIKLLHIGVNGASAMPRVPECFLWRHESGAEVVVIYSGSYGGEFKCDLVDEILYFDHTVDNRGARNEADTIKAFEKVEALYPDYDVEAGRMDDYANAIWEVRDKLPVVTSEIGDTWIHGLGTDPFKTGAVKELISIKNDAVKNGMLDPKSNEFKKLMESILCVSEHTWGGDSKVFLSDYSHYDKSGFTMARANDDVTQKPEIEATEYGIDVIEKRKTGEYNQGSYKAIEKAWQEQRNYIKAGIDALPESIKPNAINRINQLIPTEPQIKSNDKRELCCGKIKITSDENGFVDIYKDDKKLFSSSGRAPITYMAFSGDDYDCWLNNYTRDFDDNHIWSWPDFCRPYLHNVDGMYSFGEYSPSVTDIFADANSLTITYKADKAHSDDLGCARVFTTTYKIIDNSVKINVKWFNKDASRIPEATIFRLYPENAQSISATKCGGRVDISNIVEYGNRRLFACEEIDMISNQTKLQIINHHSPLCIPGFCNLVRFSNSYPSIKNDGVSYVLHDSIWGTNFPLWYEDNASFDFTINID